MLRPTALKRLLSVAIFAFLLGLLLRRLFSNRSVYVNDYLEELYKVGDEADVRRDGVLSDSSPLEQDRSSCASLQALDDVLVVLKTGATESLKKVPIHFNTTLRCVPHFVIYSDMDEVIEGHPVIDALDDVDEDIKREYPGFDLYNRMKTQGREGISAKEYTQGKGGAAWNLDKWKFLPIIDKSLAYQPSAKWFVFLEADTYVVWKNLLEWLSQVDATQPHYIGNQMEIKTQIFAHGGAGFMISEPAMRMASDFYASHRREYEQFTADHWAGDCVLGKLMQDLKIPLLWSWPLLQEHKPSQVDPLGVGWSHRLWCYPVVTYHHVNAEEIVGFTDFEQSWNDQHQSTLRFKDIFDYHLRPQMATELADWDNLSAGDEFSESIFLQHPKFASSLSPVYRKAPHSPQNCRAACEDSPSCVQWLHKPQSCRTSDKITLGEKNNTIPGSMTSGFLLERVDAVIREVEPCGNEGWILPPVRAAPHVPA